MGGNGEILGRTEEKESRELNPTEKKLTDSVLQLTKKNKGTGVYQSFPIMSLAEWAQIRSRPLYLIPIKKDA